MLKEKSEFPELKRFWRSGRAVGGWESDSVKLYEWIASYYQCDLGRVFRPLVRKGLISSKIKDRSRSIQPAAKMIPASGVLP